MEDCIVLQIPKAIELTPIYDNQFKIKVFESKYLENECLHYTWNCFDFISFSTSSIGTNLKMKSKYLVVLNTDNHGGQK